MVSLRGRLTPSLNFEACAKFSRPSIQTKPDRVIRTEYESLNCVRTAGSNCMSLGSEPVVGKLEGLRYRNSLIHTLRAGHINEMNPEARQWIIQRGGVYGDYLPGSFFAINDVAPFWEIHLTR